MRKIVLQHNLPNLDIGHPSFDHLVGAGE